MADADVALDRIDAAVAAGERIAIWGDYDADGMTAIVVWVTALRRLGADPLRYVPSRLAEGYGLSAAGLHDLAGRGVRLVVTCDCGVGNAVEVEVARSLGIDVVVTDHHLPPADAAARGGRGRPSSARLRLSRSGPDRRGARRTSWPPPCWPATGSTTDGLAAIAAIGTVADLAPMTGESRAIVRLGLDELGRAPRTPASAPCSRARARRRTSRRRATWRFGVVPRINAAGRIADAELAMSLLLEEDVDARRARSPTSSRRSTSSGAR